ncbi:S49 family peptidase [Amaricoccus solimangrovi]|uniref:S49 family peptidase n=1 Tax=Amaricoccus solimangrovi TaxID=2589815 RepID=A0A501WQ13_9RHOB|nr:S49 family peptidase [Amaricoccus solimangrovi]TPE50430.1 S49 family peptidase [Amaricoccus solimangrovi]
MFENILSRFRGRRPLVTVLRLEGVIGGGGRLGGAALNDAALAPLIEAAFTRGGPKAVAIAINSPGGSPAQSSLIAARIRRLADEKKIPVHAFVEDVAASGGYWLATAADRIHVDRNSILGSIGVISASFGFQDFIARHGIERRVHTAGTDKSMLDPFRPERAEDVARLEGLQAVIHRNFIDQVRSRRGALLREDGLFTGDFWLGEQAIELGLADALGHLVPTMKALYGEKVRFQPMAPRRPLLRRLGLPGVSETMARLEDGALWARFGTRAP